jgi:hypothetical protein
MLKIEIKNKRKTNFMKLVYNLVGNNFKKKLQRTISKTTRWNFKKKSR